MSAQPITSHPVLQANGLALAYAGPDGNLQPVLADFSLAVTPGETVALLGPSGVGKSSLLRVLAGLQSATQGSVTAHEQPLRGPHPRLGFVFQDASLLPWLRLEENVAFGLDFRHQPRLTRSERKRRVDQAIEDVGLTHARGRYPAQLSGGMAQRAALARTLARQPDILLLDEPFSALDEVTRADMQTLLQTVTSKYGAAAVLVTHDIDEALRLADRILLINGRPGRLVAQWTFAEQQAAGDPARARIRADIVRCLRDPASPPPSMAAARPSSEPEALDQAQPELDTALCI